MRIPLGLAGDETINACTSLEIEARTAPKDKRQSQGTVILYFPSTIALGDTSTEIVSVSRSASVATAVRNPSVPGGRRLTARAPQLRSGDSNRLRSLR
jgi:hypothetical protein